jgi:hypothetical protein
MYSSPFLSASHLPPVLAAEKVTLFNFYYAQAIRKGCRYNDELYALVAEFATCTRQQADRLALVLADQAVPCIFTGSSGYHQVWVLLRSPACSILIEKGHLFLETILLLHLSMSKLKQATVNKF